MDFSPETKLNKQSTFGYKSCSSSPSDLTKNYEIYPLKQLVSGSPDLFERGLSNPKDTDEDSGWDLPASVYGVPIIFSIVVTIALVLQINLGERAVFFKGTFVSDHERCTALGQRVLHDSGSSVDAAIAGALCLGVVHPHVSGVGGGGVMLVHDLRRNETRVINYQGTVPKTFKEEMLQNVSQLKTGLQVGVPGMLMGLQHAHSLYGSLSWEDVVSRAADVARKGFRVSHSLADAILKVKGEQLSQRFRDIFIPHGQALSPGSYVKMSSLAGVLEAGVMNFYHGNISQEIEEEVRSHGGVLTREDIRNYSVAVEQPLEGRYNEFIIQVPPPPSAGAVLISSLNLLKGFRLSENNITENQTYHRIAEALKAALAMANSLGDPKYKSSVAELLSDIKSWAEVRRQKMNSSRTATSDSPLHFLQTELMAGQVVVMGPDNLMVSVASSLSRPFGSRMVTRSGIILNSLILDFSWLDKTRDQLQSNQKSNVVSGKRPPLFLMPTVMVPARNKCGLHMALSSSVGRNHLNAVTQMLVSALFLHKEKNESLSLRNLYSKLEPDGLLVDSEFSEGRRQILYAKSHVVQRVKTNSAVQGIWRSKDVTEVIENTQLPDTLL